MHRRSLKTVCTSQFRQRCASLKAVAASKPSSASILMLLSAFSAFSQATLWRASADGALS